MMMMLRILKRSLLIALSYKIVSLLASGNVCSKRFVRGKWVSHGNCENRHDVIGNVKKKAETPHGIIEETTKSPTTRPISTYSSCRGVNRTVAKHRNETGGVFDIAIPGVGTKEVFCNTKTDGGGWIVFQRRIDGRVDFYENWNEYVTGFGTADGEYWLGLEAIHQLTKDGNAEMRIDMIARDGTYYHAKYSTFQIGPSSDNYKLTVSGFSGNGNNNLAYHNNRQFSTKDRDNDQDSNNNFAVTCMGSWWYRFCGYSNLNGVYGLTTYQGIFWYDGGSPGDVYMNFVEMKLRNRM